LARRGIIPDAPTGIDPEVMWCPRGDTVHTHTAAVVPMTHRSVSRGTRAPWWSSAFPAASGAVDRWLECGHMTWRVSAVRGQEPRGREHGRDDSVAGHHQAEGDVPAPGHSPRRCQRWTAHARQARATAVISTSAVPFTRCSTSQPVATTAAVRASRHGPTAARGRWRGSCARRCAQARGSAGHRFAWPRSPPAVAPATWASQPCAGCSSYSSCQFHHTYGGVWG
jgi:hypothetical protein